MTTMQEWVDYYNNCIDEGNGELMSIDLTVAWFELNTEQMLELCNTVGNS